MGLPIGQKILSIPKLVAQHSKETAKGKEQLVINATAKIRLPGLVNKMYVFKCKLKEYQTLKV